MTHTCRNSIILVGTAADGSFAKVLHFICRRPTLTARLK